MHVVRGRYSAKHMTSNGGCKDADMLPTTFLSLRSAYLHSGIVCATGSAKVSPHTLLAT